MRWQRAVFALGLVLWLVLLVRIGSSVVLRNVASIGWGFAAVLSLESLTLLLTTLAWRATFSRLRAIPFRSLVATRLAGDSVNSLAPAAVVGGEAVRARLLMGRLPSAEALVSVGLAAMTQFIAQVLFVAIGSALFPVTPLAARFHGWAPGALAGTALVLACAFAARRARRTSSPPGAGRLAAWIARVDARGRLVELRRGVSTAMREEKGGLALSIAFFFAGWLVTILEVALILRLLRISVPLSTSATVAVVTVLVEGVFFFVPARVGVAEGGSYAIFSVLGLDPAQGFSLAIVRRLRELVWALVGLTILFAWRARARAYVIPMDRKQPRDS